MNFDLSCVKCLNLFDSMEESKNFLSVNTLSKLAKTTVTNGNLVQKKNQCLV